MPKLIQSPILDESFAIIDREIGDHHLSPQEYAVARRVIHSIADFDYLQLLEFRHQAIAAGLKALRRRCPIIVDVTMVRQGVIGMVQRTFDNPVLTAVSAGDDPLPGRTRTETGLLRCLAQAPEAVVVIGNAPKSLLALVAEIAAHRARPSQVIGVPVGFVAVQPPSNGWPSLRSLEFAWMVEKEGPASIYRRQWRFNIGRSRSTVRFRLVP